VGKIPLRHRNCEVGGGLAVRYSNRIGTVAFPGQVKLKRHRLGASPDASERVGARDSPSQGAVGRPHCFQFERLF
jgi:hypothetical protein